MLILPTIFGLLLGVIAVVFSSQNVDVVTITFFNWQFQSSLAVIFISGIFFSLLLIVLPETLKTSLKLKVLKKENKNLEEELRKQKELTVFAKDVLPTEAIIKKIENGAIDEPNN